VSLAYRADIQGLRAVAIISVVLFHVEIAPFSGGYIGVDVFFVISGFLITHLIKNDIDSGNFSFADFYIRRARRLFPALFVVVFFVFAFSAYQFIPQHFARLGGSVLSSLTWVSNIFFWSEHGYFAAEASVKPLLHTWSLSVEEQIYLVWPLVLLFALSSSRRRIAPVIILLLSIVSLYLAERWVQSGSSAGFFLTPARIYEFGIGALLVWLPSYESLTQSAIRVSALRIFVWLKEVALLGGLLMIGYAVVYFDPATPFPGLHALVPCIGAALAVYAGQSKSATCLLSNSPMVYIGRVSYSFYLVHWPIVIFYKYGHPNLDALDKVFLISASFAAALVLHYSVEKRFRLAHKGSQKDNQQQTAKSSKTFLLACVAGTGCMIVPAATVWLQQGLVLRAGIPEPIVRIIEAQKLKGEESWQFVSDTEGANPNHFSEREDVLRVLIVGDSHGADIFNAIYLNSNLYQDWAVRRLSFRPECLFLLSPLDTGIQRLSVERKQWCDWELSQLDLKSLVPRAHKIVYVARWSHEHIKYIPMLAQHLAARTNAELVLLGRKAEFGDVPTIALSHGSMEGLGQRLATLRDSSIDTLNHDLRISAAAEGISVLDLLPLICEPGTNRCDAVDENNNFLYYDSSHWTLEGARYFGAKLHTHQFWKSLGEIPWHPGEQRGSSM